MKLKQFIIFTFLVLLSNFSFSQDKNVTLPANWYNLDLAKDGYFGISTEKAYTELLKNKTPKQKVIVAVMDGGTDVKHEDLKDVLWTNTKEIPGNGIDDDKNGYIDDIHGWNFLGSKNGSLQYDTKESTRIIRKLRPKYLSVIPSTKLDSAEKEEFRLYQKATIAFGREYDSADQNFRYISMIVKMLDSAAFTAKRTAPILADIEKYVPDNEIEGQLKSYILKESKKAKSFDKFYQEMKKAYKDLEATLKYHLNLQYDPRAAQVGDDYANSNERFYGNNDYAGPDAEHGTHVAGIIGGNRNNSIGINGVANNVSIMVIRVVPDGDERDKDVANGIRYAVDNGAKVINMSFGKAFKWDKKAVDEAVKYAEQKGVLLVHAAGNDNADNDRDDNFPNKYYDSPEALAYQASHRGPDGSIINRIDVKMSEQANQQRSTRTDYSAFLKPAPLDSAKFQLPHATNWIEVGASTYKDDANLKASFSNYGKNIVDVFAPGFMINSTVPGSKYEENDGTSMASPVVAGLAALILTYYPEFTPAQVRDIIIKSAVKVTKKVKYDYKGESLRVPLTDLSVSGGIANAYNALKMAETYR